MDIVLTTALATDRRAYERGERVAWPSEADARRLIDAGLAKPADPTPDPKPAPKGAK